MPNTGTLKVATPTDLEVVMTRAFDAPRHRVWEAMTRPALIRRCLFTPPRWSMTTCEEDLRAGSAHRWAWSGPDGKPVMAMHGVYREAVLPRPDRSGGRLVRNETPDFGCDAQMGQQVGTLEFAKRGGRTIVTITVAYPSKQARDAAIASGVEHGVSTGYDNLERLLTEHAWEK